jgi:hypothetical protein
MTKASGLSLASGVSSRLSWCLSWFLPIVCALLIGAFGLRVARAQGPSQDEVKSGPTASDKAAADEATIVYRHAKPANTPGGSALKHKDVTASVAGPTSEATAEDNDQIRFPGDLTYNGGPVVTAAESHAIYLLPHGKCPIATCWGNPEGFLGDVEISEFAHITDQYVHSGASNRYTVGKHTMISYTPTPKTAPLTDLDMQAVVHAVAALSGQTGYGHIYHVFLPPGQDECFTATDHVCYSPDVPATFVFCAYHSSVDFKDIGHVLYSVEPFQNVNGCSVRPGTPNGQLVDSTNNVLSHELIETITDPDGTAWFNILDNGLFGQEIGDECSFLAVAAITPKLIIVGFDPSVFTLGKHRYAIQPEYSNDAHACATSF